MKQGGLRLNSSQDLNVSEKDLMWRCLGTSFSQITRAMGQSLKICKVVSSIPGQFWQEGSTVNPRLALFLLLMIQSCPTNHRKKRIRWGIKAFQIADQIGSRSLWIWARIKLRANWVEKLPFWDPTQDHWSASWIEGYSSKDAINLITSYGSNVSNFSHCHPL